MMLSSDFFFLLYTHTAIQNHFRFLCDFCYLREIQSACSEAVDQPAGAAAAITEQTSRQNVAALPSKVTFALKK